MLFNDVSPKYKNNVTKVAICHRFHWRRTNHSALRIRCTLLREPDYITRHTTLFITLRVRYCTSPAYHLLISGTTSICHSYHRERRQKTRWTDCANGGSVKQQVCPHLQKMCLAYPSAFGSRLRTLTTKCVFLDKQRVYVHLPRKPGCMHFNAGAHIRARYLFEKQPVLGRDGDKNAGWGQ